MKFSSKFKLGLLSLLSLLLITTGCLKNDIKVDNTPRSFVMLAHMAIHAPRAVMYIDDATQVSNTLLVKGISNSYGLLNPGSYKISFKKDGSDSLLTATGSKYSFDSTQSYTIMTYSNYDSTTNMSIVRDDFSGVTTNNCVVRFLQLSPEDMPVDVYLDDMKVWSNRTLADHEVSTFHQKFESLTPKMYDITVTKANEPENVLVSLTDQNFRAQNAYTIWFTGTSDASITKRYSLELQAANYGGF